MAHSKIFALKELCLLTSIFNSSWKSLFCRHTQSENTLRLESAVRHENLPCEYRKANAILWKSWLGKHTCKAVGHMHFSGVLISISVSELMTLPSLSVLSVVSGHKPWLCSPPYLPYCANSMEMVVPRGQLNCTYSWSQPAFWYVLRVPESRAERRSKWRQIIDLWFPAVD